MPPEPGKPYPPQVRAQAVTMVTQEGIARAEVCRTLGISATTLRRWLQQPNALRTTPTAASSPASSYSAAVPANMDLLRIMRTIDSLQSTEASFTSRCELIVREHHHCDLSWLLDELQVSPLAFYRWIAQRVLNNTHGFCTAEQLHWNLLVQGFDISTAQVQAIYASLRRKPRSRKHQEWTHAGRYCATYLPAQYFSPMWPLASLDPKSPHPTQHPARAMIAGRCEHNTNLAVA